MAPRYFEFFDFGPGNPGKPMIECHWSDEPGRWWIHKPALNRCKVGYATQIARVKAEWAIVKKANRLKHDIIVRIRRYH